MEGSWRDRLAVINDEHRWYIVDTASPQTLYYPDGRVFTIEDNVEPIPRAELLQELSRRGWTPERLYDLPTREHTLIHCYHEAGHAVALWHHGIKLDHVTMNPAPRSWHWGQTVAVEHDVNGLAQIEAEMRCAVAGLIAEYKLLPTLEKRTRKADG